MKLLKKLSYPGSGWALGFRSENKWIKTFNGLIKFNGKKVKSDFIAGSSKLLGQIEEKKSKSQSILDDLFKQAYTNVTALADKS